MNTQSNCRQRQQGFTLIELMIVVTIIAILSALAIPSYLNYTNRAKVVSALQRAAQVKIQVSEYFLATGSFPDKNEEAGSLDAKDYAGGYVKRIDVEKDGVIEIELDDPAFEKKDTVKLVPSSVRGNIIWKYQSDDIIPSMLPPECR